LLLSLFLSLFGCLCVCLCVCAAAGPGLCVCGLHACVLGLCVQKVMRLEREGKKGGRAAAPLPAHTRFPPPSSPPPHTLPPPSPPWLSRCPRRPSPPASRAPLVGCGLEGQGRARGRNGREKQQRQFSVGPPARCRLPLPPCLCLTLSSPSQSTLTSQSPAAPAGPSRSSLLGECALSAWGGGVASGVARAAARAWGGRDSSPCHSLSRRRRRAVAGRLHGRLGTGGRGVRCPHLPPARRGWQRRPSTGLWVRNACSRPPRSPRSRHSSPHRLSPPSLFSFQRTAPRPSGPSSCPSP
jgi:hypothetical protein